jgi:hypothetical protein
MTPPPSPVTKDWTTHQEIAVRKALSEPEAPCPRCGLAAEECKKLTDAAWAKQERWTPPPEAQK